MSIVSAVNGLYVGTSGYGGLDESVIIKTSSVPENYKGVDDQTIMHPFGGKINIVPIVDDTAFYIVLSDVPKVPCVSIASMNFGTQLVGVGVGNTAANTAQYIFSDAPTDGKQQLSSTALSPDKAVSACSEDSNKIVFQLR